MNHLFSRPAAGNPRPALNPVPVSEVLDGVANGLGICVVTMSIGQWDRLLAGAYDDGVYLLELDDDEMPVTAYRKEGAE